MKCLLILLVFWSSNVYAENNLFFTFGGWSYHTDYRDYKFDGKRSYNETHSPLGFEYEINEEKYSYSFEIMTFITSTYTRSNMIGGNYRYKFPFGSLGAKVFLATGYEEKTYYYKGRSYIANYDNQKYVFLISPSYDFNFENIKFELLFTPKYQELKETLHETNILILMVKILIY